MISGCEGALTRSQPCVCAKALARRGRGRRRRGAGSRCVGPMWPRALASGMAWVLGRGCRQPGQACPGRTRRRLPAWSRSRRDLRGACSCEAGLSRSCGRGRGGVGLRHRVPMPSAAAVRRGVVVRPRGPWVRQGKARLADWRIFACTVGRERVSYGRRPNGRGKSHLINTKSRPH